MPGADVTTLGAAAVYAVVIGFVFVECALLIGFFLPGDTLLFAAGLVAADAARGVSPWWLGTGVLVAAIGGECVGYLLGARMGPVVLRRRRGRVRTDENLARAERFAARYGVFALIAARWIPWVRTFAPLLAGAARMPWPRFMVANVVGAVCWGPTLLLLGYFAGSLPGVSHAALVVAAVLVAAGTVAGTVRWRRTGRTAADPPPLPPTPPPAGPSGPGRPGGPGGPGDRATGDLPTRPAG